MKRLLSLGLILLFGLMAVSFAQSDKPADNMDILRDKIKADKKLLIASNMGLTEEEAKGFWPVYDAYQAGLAKINERLKKLVLSYADAWNNSAVTPETAQKLTQEGIAIQEAEVQLNKEFLPKLDAVLPPVKVMRYLQMENKIRALIRYDLAAGVPLAE